MTKKKTNSKILRTAEHFNEQWNSCLCWLNSGPKSYQGKYYFKDYENDEGHIEQIYVNDVPEDIKTTIQLVWEDAITQRSSGPWNTFTRYISEELHQELPFRNDRNADVYAHHNYKGEELRLKYMNSFNPFRTLTDLFATQEANCVSHALAIKESIPDKAFQLFNIYYENVFDENGFEKLGIHTILAKLEHNTITAIDSSEGPINAKDKHHPFQYTMIPEEFCKHYTPAVFRNEPIKRK